MSSTDTDVAVCMPVMAHCEIKPHSPAFEISFNLFTREASLPKHFTYTFQFYPLNFMSNNKFGICFCIMYSYLKGGFQYLKTV